MSRHSSRVSVEIVPVDEITTAPLQAPVLPPYSQSVEDDALLPRYTANNEFAGDTAIEEFPYREVIDEQLRNGGAVVAVPEAVAYLPTKKSNKDVGPPAPRGHNGQPLGRLGLALYAAIDKGDCEYVLKVFETGLMNANTPHAYGSGRVTPLICAVHKRNREMARCLLEHGATVDQPAVYELWQGADKVRYRTPLQLAALQGDLPMVKLLIEEFHADPSVIAADGQHALRLAADAGHNQVVQYLPAVRGGGLRRLKFKCRKPIRKIVSAAKNVGEFIKALTYHLPRCIFVYCIYRPTVYLVKAIWKGLKALPSFIRRQAQLAPGRFQRLCVWIKEQIVKIPERTKKICVWAYEQLKKTPDRLVRLAKLVPRVCNAIMKCIIDLVKEVWSGIELVASYISKAAKIVGSAFIDIWQRLISLLHTTFAAIWSFFRSLTLTNIYHGLLDLLRAIFITFPQAVGKVMGRFWKSFFYVMEKMFDCVGILIACVIYVVWGLMTYIPVQIWKMIVATGQLIGGVGKEVRIWWDPKAGVD